MRDLMTLGSVAVRFGCQTWQVRRLFETGRLPPAQRIGLYRVVPESDLPKIEVALREAGYLKANETACAPT